MHITAMSQFVHSRCSRPPHCLLHAMHRTAGAWELAKLADYSAPPLTGTLLAAAEAAAVRNQDDVQGVPVLKDVMAALVCRKAAAFEAGDHIVLLGHVSALTTSTTCSPQ